MVWQEIQFVCAFVISQAMQLDTIAIIYVPISYKENVDHKKEHTCISAEQRQKTSHCEDTRRRVRFLVAGAPTRRETGDSRKQLCAPSIRRRACIFRFDCSGRDKGRNLLN